MLTLLVVFGIVFAVKTWQNQASEEIEGEELSFAEIEKIEVPELGAEPEDESFAVPVSVADAAPGITTNHLRTFLISAENGEFTPSTVIVYKNDTVRINFTAVDGTYDITVPDLGLKQTAEEGETKPLEFRAEIEGAFVYYCELCGGESSTAKGRIIVKLQ